MYRNFLSLLVALLMVVLAAQAQAALVDYLPLDDGTGTTAVNSVNPAYNGTFGSFHIFYDTQEEDTTGLGPNPTWVAGKFGGAVQFAGSATQKVNGNWGNSIGNLISVPSGGGLSGTSTASMWVKWSSGTQPLAISSDSWSNKQYGCVLGQGNSNNVIGLNYNGAPATANGLRYGQTALYARTPPTDGTDGGSGYGLPQMPAGPSTPPGTDWVNVVAVYGGGNATIYMNGAALRTVAGSGNSNTLTLGGWTDIRPGQGVSTGASNSTIDDFGVFNATLSAGKAMSIYNTTLVAGLGGYTLDKMNTLFGVYDTATPATIGSLVWSQVLSGLPGAAGSAGITGGMYYVTLDGSGGGVETSTIPEPGTLALLAAGLAGLLCYAWRKRR